MKRFLPFLMMLLAAGWFVPLAGAQELFEGPADGVPFEVERMYVKGLLSDLTRKTIEGIALAFGEKQIHVYAAQIEARAYDPHREDERQIGEAVPLGGEIEAGVFRRRFECQTRIADF